MPDYTAVHDECMYAGEARSTMWLKRGRLKTKKQQPLNVESRGRGSSGGLSAGWAGGAASGPRCQFLL